jgi:Tol biopolymer transport system component
MLNIRLRSAGCLALVAAAAALCAPPAEAGIPGNNGWIAFDSRRGGDSDLYRVAPDGTRESRLPVSVAGANDARPAWAPRPALAVFEDVSETAAGQIRIGGSGLADATATVAGKPARTVSRDDGALVVELPAGTSATDPVCVSKPIGYLGMIGRARPASGQPGDPASECDSQPIAFQSDRSGDHDVWLYDPASPLGARNPLDLTPWRGSHETAPAWSSIAGSAPSTVPAVRQRPLLAFASDRHGSRDIFVLDPGRPVSSANPARVTTNPGDDTNPEWSADGRHLVFESDRRGPKDLWAVAIPDAGVPIVPEMGILQLTDDDQPSFDPSWTSFDPGGNAIAFSGPEAGSDCELNLIAGPDRFQPPKLGTQEYTLPAPASKEDGAAFAPLGTPLAFAGVRAGNEDIYVHELPNANDPAGQVVTRRLTGSAGPDRHPSWQQTFHAADLHLFRVVGRKSRRKRRTRSVSALDGRPCSEPAFARFTFKASGRQVTFDARSTTDVDGPVDRFEWDLDGDGRFEASGPVVRRMYAAKGTRPAVLRVVDQDGDVRRVRRDVAVGGCTQTGTSGPDVLAGTPGRDVLCGRGGRDVIYGSGGGDVLRGGPGADRLFGEAGADRLNGGGGRDRLKGGTGRDRIAARDRRRDVLRGGSGRDRARTDRRLDKVRGVEVIR